MDPFAPDNGQPQTKAEAAEGSICIIGHQTSHAATEAVERSVFGVQHPGSQAHEDIPTINTTSTTNGPITRSRAKQIRDQVNANLSLSYNFDLDEMLCFHLPCCWLNSGTSLKESHNNKEQSFNNKFSSYQQKVFNKSAALNTTSDLS
jgi:hypothetical protein